jgi:hypothetical protein
MRQSINKQPKPLQNKPPPNKTKAPKAKSPLLISVAGFEI